MLGVVPNDNNVIYIEQKVDDGAGGMENEQRTISHRGSEPKMKEMKGKLLKLCPRCLFESLK